MGLEYKFKENKNLLGSIDAKINAYKVIGDIRLSYGRQNSINGKLELYNIKQTGESNTSTSYELLDGLQKGNNIVINFLFTQFVSKNLELSVIYDCKISQVAPAVHTARMQIRAIF